MIGHLSQRQGSAVRMKVCGKLGLSQSEQRMQTLSNTELCQHCIQCTKCVALYLFKMHLKVTWLIHLLLLLSQMNLEMKVTIMAYKCHFMNTFEDFRMHKSSQNFAPMFKLVSILIIAIGLGCGTSAL